MLPFVPTDLDVSEQPDNEDAMFSELEARIDDFLEQENVFVSHVDEAKQALFDPFIVKQHFSRRHPNARSSYNKNK